MIFVTKFKPEARTRFPNNNGATFIGLIKPASGDRAHYHTNINAIADMCGFQLYGLIRIKFVCKTRRLEFSMAVNPPRNRQNNTSNRPTLPLNLPTVDEQLLWMYTVSEAMATGQQTLAILLNTFTFFYFSIFLPSVSNFQILTVIASACTCTCSPLHLYS